MTPEEKTVFKGHAEAAARLKHHVGHVTVEAAAVRLLTSLALEAPGYDAARLESWRKFGEAQIGRAGNVKLRTAEYIALVTAAAKSPRCEASQWGAGAGVAGAGDALPELQGRPAAAGVSRAVEPTGEAAGEGDALGDNS